jgi:hypothetical protein
MGDLGCVATVANGLAALVWLIWVGRPLSPDCLPGMRG